MPVLDGAGVARRMRKAEGHGTHFRILAVSAHLEPDEREDFIEAGADAVLIKPFDDSQLLAPLTPASHRVPHAAAKLAPAPQLLPLLQDYLPPQFDAPQRSSNAHTLAAGRNRESAGGGKGVSGGGNLGD